MVTATIIGNPEMSTPTLQRSSLLSTSRHNETSVSSMLGHISVDGAVMDNHYLIL